MKNRGVGKDFVPCYVVSGPRPWTVWDEGMCIQTIDMIFSEHDLWHSTKHRSIVTCLVEFRIFHLRLLGELGDLSPTAATSLPGRPRSTLVRCGSASARKLIARTPASSCTAWLGTALGEVVVNSARPRGPGPSAVEVPQLHLGGFGKDTGMFCAMCPCMWWLAVFGIESFRIVTGSGEHEDE